MDAFLQNILSYPTVFFTVFGGFAFLYLLLAAVGLAGFDDTDFELEMLSGLMTTLGLKGVPLSLVLGLVALFSWATCYLIVALLSVGPVGNWINYLIGTLAIPVSLAASVLLTAQAVKPLRPLFRALNASAPDKVLIGALCTVRSSQVTETFGEVTTVIDGAELILKVRADSSKALKRGDKVVLIEHHKDTNLFWVVPEHEFKS
jgi:hypothetical protein